MFLSVGNVWGAEELYYTLTPAKGSNNSYAGNCDVAISDITWNLTGNSTMQPWRIGGKSLSNVDRTVYSKTAMSSAITKVELEVGGASGITVNSLTLIVASDADFNTQIDAVSGTFEANSTITFTPTSPATEWATGAYYKFVFNVSVSGSSNNFVEFKNAKFYTEEASGNVIVKTLESIAVTGQTTEYEVGDDFSFDGTCTATYSVTVNDEPQADEHKVVTPTSVSSPDMTSEGQKEVTVTYTDATVSKTTKYNITVNPHTITPDEYTINLNNTFFGVATGNNGAEQTKTKNDITFVAGCASTAQNKTYYDAGHVRFYTDSYLHISVPSGYRITSIVFTAGGTWNGGISANVGSYADDTKTWSGKAQEVEFSFTLQDRIAIATVTFEVDAPETACETPTFDPAAGEYEEAQNVTISCATEDATIYYTIDGTNPKESVTKSEYTGAISVTEAKTIKAYATKTGLLDSEVAEAEYTFVAGPEVTLDFTTNDDWNFPTDKTVDADDYTAGGYTITVAGSDGNGYNFDTDHLFLGKKDAYITLPTFDFPVSKVVCVGVESGSGNVTFNLFEGSTSVSTAVTSCKVDQTFEIDEEDQSSNKTYTIKLTNAYNARFAKIKVYRGVEPAVVKPVISGEENFVTSTEVTITCETTGATIYYTTNGDDPKVSGITSPNPFNLTSAATVKAAAKLGDNWSAIAEKSFTKVDALTTMEAVQAAMPNAGTEHINIVIEDWIVTANKSGQSQVWIANADNTKGILLYQSGHGFAAGNKLNGVVLNVGITKYNTAPQLMSFTSEDVTVTTASAITPNETTIDAITTAIQGTVIKLKDLTYSSANSNFSDGEHTIAIDTRLYAPALVNDATYDLTGVVMFANGGAVKLIPRWEEDVVKTSADPLPEVNNLAGLKAAELGSYNVNLTNAVVTFADDKNAFIEDATAGAFIYYNNGGHGFVPGDKLNGKYEVTTAEYNGKFEITAIIEQAGAETTHNAEIPVTTLTIADLNDNDIFAANESRRIKIIGVNVTDAIGNSDRNGEISEGNNTFILYAGKSGVVAELNANIDAIGYPTYYIKGQTNDHQFSIWAQSDITVNAKADAELSWTRESDVIVEGATWTAPTLNNPYGVTIASYETDNDAVATVTNGVIELAGGLGTANITAHFAGDQTYEAADVVYTITVNEFVPENTDIITAAKIGVAGTNAYDDWIDKNVFGTTSVYAGNSANAAAPNTGAIQLRSKNNSGIVLTSSNGLYLKNLSVTVKSGTNTLNVYAKNSAYTSTADLYNEETRGTLIGTVSATGEMTLEEGISYNDNYQYIGMRSANNALYLDDITITWGDAYVAPDFGSYQRDVTNGNYGTICLPKAGTISGATLFEIGSFENNMIYVDEVLNGAMEAGKPYIFQATADQLNVTYTSATVEENAGSANGLHGFYDLNDEDAQKNLDQNDDNYILYQNAYWLVSGRAAYIANYRAYIKIGEIENTPAPQQGAPRRRVAMTVHGEQVATGVDALNAAEAPVKMIIDGQLFIIRGEKMYDATGRLVK